MANDNANENNYSISPTLAIYKLDDETLEAEFVSSGTGFTRIDGPWSWMMSFLMLASSLVTFGSAATYGILFPNILEDFQSTRALTAVPGSIAVANSGLMGPLIGKLCDHFGSRKILFLGSLASASGLIASSYVQNIGLLMVTFGLILGTAVGFTYFSTMVAVSMYFDKYRFEATSIASVGGGSSLVAMSPVVLNLNRVLDWRGSMLALSGFSSIPFVVSILMRSKPSKSSIQTRTVNRRLDQNTSSCCPGELIYFSAFKIKIFLLTTIVVTISGTGHSMSLVHLAKFSEDIGIDSNKSSWLYFVIGLSSTVSRLLVGKFGKAGLLSLPDIFVLGNVILALGNFILPSTTMLYALVLYGIGYGVGEGLMYCSSANIIMDSIPDDKRGSGYGLFQMFASLAYIIGPILSGLIADFSGSYNTTFYTAGSLEAFAGCLCILSHFISTDRKVISVGESLDTQLVVTEKETVL